MTSRARWMRFTKTGIRTVSRQRSWTIQESQHPHSGGTDQQHTLASASGGLQASHRAGAAEFHTLRYRLVFQPAALENGGSGQAWQQFARE